MESLYTLFSSEQEKKTKKTVDLEDGVRLDIEFNSFLTIYHTDKSGVVGMCRMNLRQIKKVFGKS